MFQSPTIRPITAHTDEDNVSWDASAKYQVSDQTNVYGRVATGFRAPSIQGRILFAPDFAGGLDPATNGVSVADEEEILSFEIGTKTELLNRKLRLGLGLFQYEVDGQQLTAVGGEFNVNTLLNADTEGYGFEADVEWAPTAAFQVTLRREQQPDRDQGRRITVAPCGGGCTVTDPVVGGLALIEGNSLPHAPEWIFNGIIDYRQPAGEGILVASLDWAYGDERNFFLYESEEFNADSFELGARIGFTFAEARYEVAAYAPQPHRRGDHPGRHRLQQPDRHDERSAHDRDRADRPVVAPQPFDIEFHPRPAATPASLFSGPLDRLLERPEREPVASLTRMRLPSRAGCAQVALSATS